jgi:hypothetical protein
MRYDQIVHYIGKGVSPVVLEGEHTCQSLAEENLRRDKNGELKVYVFRDIDNGQWNLRVGLEFVVVKLCPWCGERLG